MRRRHTVPLSLQVIGKLEELWAFLDQGNIFSPVFGPGRQLFQTLAPWLLFGAWGMNLAKCAFMASRAMASTRLNELGYRADVIEAQLAHKEPDAVRLAYNRAEYTEERRKLMQEWADYLVHLKGI